MTIFRSGTMAAPAAWDKGLAVSERFIFDIATRPILVGLLREILGKEIILWGTMFAQRQPHAVHPWHCDIESSAPQGSFVSVWIGLENTTRASALKLVARSHRFGRTIQEVQSDHNFRRGEADDAQVLSWAHDLDPDSEIVQPEMSDGEAIVFDGRLWHGSENGLAEDNRTALLLQYARGDASVYMPDLTQLEWPNRLIVDRRPPVLTVSGRADEEANRVAPPPTHGGPGQPTTIFTRSLALPLERELEGGWKPHFLFNGPTAALPKLSCHVSVLEAGHCPHPPHAHIEEELLMVLDGKAEIVIATSPDDPTPRREQFAAGDFVYHPAYQHHTIRNTSAEPVTYLMLKWCSAPLEVQEPLGPTVVRLSDFPARPDPKPFDPQILFEKPTAFLSKLHSHVTDLQPGAGYDPHTDDYDVAILLLEGQISTVGKTLTAPAIAFYARHELHGMQNVGSAPARYVVLELHGDDKAAATAGSRHRPPGRDTESLGREIAFLRQERDALKAESRKLSVDAATMRAQLRMICNSRSWRYTSPMRSALLFVRRHVPGLE